MARIEKQSAHSRRRVRKGVPRRVLSARQLVARARAHSDTAALVRATRIPTGVCLSLQCGSQMAAAEVDAMLAGMSDELHALYNEASDDGWDSHAKRVELTHEHQRVLVASDDDGRVAFLSFRFDIEFGSPVLYVYELFVERRARRRGLGVALMRAAEDIAAALNIPALMLTAFVANGAAMRLYREKLGYEIAEMSPSNFVEPGDPAPTYEILKRTLL